MLFSSLSCLASFVILLLSVTWTATAGDFRSGLSAYNRGDYITAFRDWRPLAEHGDAVAQAGLGFLFHKGLGVIQDDIEAATWFEKAAAQNQAEAQLLLGTLYFLGRAYSRIIRWRSPGAKSRNRTANLTLWNVGTRHWNT